METVTQGRAPAAMLDPARWVEEHGDCMFHYALARVRMRETAEDLVQDTFLVAVRTQERFAGRASERTWLVGILKHKIVDHYRKRGRETTFTDLDFLQDELSHQFDEAGWWLHERGPHAWKAPVDAVVHRDEFWRMVRDCLDKLPARVATVFALREMAEVPSKEICATLNVSAANLWVMLHRARMALRESLEIQWFDRVPTGRTQKR